MFNCSLMPRMLNFLLVEISYYANKNKSKVNKKLPPPARILVNANNYTVSEESESMELPAIEFALFNLLFSSANCIYNQSQIINLVYQDYSGLNDRKVDS